MQNTGRITQISTPKKLQISRGWCSYIWCYRYDKHCTTTYQGLYSVDCGTAKNDTGKTKFSGAYYSTGGQWSSSTCISAKSLLSTRARPVPKARGNPLTTPARASPSRRVTRTARRAKRRARTTARARARSERGLRRMLKSVSGISNRGLSHVCFHSIKTMRICIFGTSFALQSRVRVERSYMYEESDGLAQEPKRSPTFECISSMD